jgi:4-amino-4-deoxy-L-arabinose transferase-like glycosyltransferase
LPNNFGSDETTMKDKNVFILTPLSLNKSNIWIIIVIFSGFLARVLWWAYSEPIPVSDFEEYLCLAKGFLQLGQYGIPNPSAYHLPGYPIFLAIMLVISDSISWLSFVNVIMSTLMIYIVYKLTLILTSEKLVSIIAALVCAFNPTFVFFSPVLASEHLFAILLFLAFMVLLNNYGDQSTNRGMKLILAGILFGAAVLTRGEGIFYLLILLLMTYFTSKRNNRSYLEILIILLLFIVTITPYYIRNYYSVGPGSGLSTTGGINFYYAHNEKQYGWHSLDGSVFDGKDEIQQQKLGYHLGFDYLINHSILRIVKDIARGTKALYLSSSAYSLRWSTSLPIIEGTTYRSKQLKWINCLKYFTLSYFLLLSAAILSCLFLRQYDLRMWAFLYGIVVMNWIGYAWIFWGKARYRYISEIVFCILAAISLYQIRRWILVRRNVVSLIK